MKWKKRKAIFISISFLVVFGVILFAAEQRYDRKHFCDELIPYTDAENDKSSRVYMDYDKSTFHISPEEVAGIYKTLVRGKSDRRRLYLKPDRGDNSIKIRFGSEVKIIVTLIDEETEACYISYTKVEDRRTKYYYLEGYDTFEWLLRIIQSNQSNRVTRELKQ